MKAVGTVATYNSDEGKEYYIGVRDKEGIKLTDSNYVFQALYVIKESDYNIDTKYYDGIAPRKSKSKVAYCFNKSIQNIPMNDFWGTWNYNFSNENERCKYLLMENVSGDDFIHYATTYDTTGNPQSSVRLQKGEDGEDLRKWIISVALNGYPTNYSGFYDSSTISNSQARLLTQFAIWYFTDSYDLDTTGLTSEEKDLYQKLISTELPDSVTSYAASSVNIFRYEGCEDGLLRQNLLTVETKEPETTPETPNDTLSLTLTKKAIGNIPSGSKFHFTLILKDKDGNLIQSTSNTLVKFNSKGEAEFDLGVNESLTIEGLPYGYSYSIKENNALNYDTVIKIGSGGIADIDNENKSISKPYVTSNEEIEYQNKILYSLVLSKEVNNDNDRNKEFEFIMELKDAEGKPYTSNLNYVSDGASGVITFDEKGKSNPFKIKGGSQIEISNQLPSGYNLTINENDDKYYTKITAYNSKNEIIQKLENTKSMSFSDLSDNLSIVYRNTPEEEKDNISISITKNVNSSNTADKTKQYKFRIKITKDGKPIDKERLYYYVGAGKSIQSIILENGEGIIEVSAGSNQYVTTVGGEFGIPSGCNIEIEEIEAEGFITNITVGDKEYTNTKTVILNNVTKDTDIIYTNNQQVVVPTGIRIDILPYLIIMLLAMGAVVGFVIRRRVVKGR
jgi:TQXA domain-containing protein